MGPQAAVHPDRIGGQILAGFRIVIAIEVIVQTAFRIFLLAGEAQRAGGGVAFPAGITAPAFAQQRAGGAGAAP